MKMVFYVVKISKGKHYLQSQKVANFALTNVVVKY